MKIICDTLSFLRHRQTLKPSAVATLTDMWSNYINISGPTVAPFLHEMKQGGSLACFHPTVNLLIFILKQINNLHFSIVFF